MAWGALTLPFTDTDLTDANEIVLSVGGGGDVTATVALPVSGAALDYGYYNYKTGGPSVSDSLAQAVADALATATSRTVTVSEQATGMPGRPKFTFGGSPANINIKWTDAGTTFDGRWLGFDTSSNSSSLSQALADWPAARMFLPRRTINAPRVPKPTKVSSKTMAGRVATFEITTGYDQYRFVFPSLSPPRILKWYGEQSDWIAAVPDFELNDPNTAFEALWEWFGIRAPLRWHPDRDTDGTYVELSVPDQELLNDIQRIIGDPAEAGPNPLFTVDFKATGYV